MSENSTPKGMWPRETPVDGDAACSCDEDGMEKKEKKVDTRMEGPTRKKLKSKVVNRVGEMQLKKIEKRCKSIQRKKKK